ncbi:MAG TPA: alanine--glyoxylate aminotransferase family protein [Candidatus Egerieimonas intestinavium]|uniref:Alanine--glyoxylate aminotransferase family protein n=1 Tax=Candidatus Egerieimonas intestinavium TaxID=2840777 RepID=A0A9D1EIA8_9FIRM|nr:alanine--glyoxylate aminotransferase family protein [Candidatus Egerieimonas intestinavium]
MYEIMTPGPTEVAENVRMARSLPCTNPDLDLDFYEYYRETCQLISRLVGTKGESLILGGEGILGLEAACATLTEPGDRVLVVDNGVFGRGFQDFVKMYGGEAVLYTTDYRKPVDPAGLEKFLEKDHEFKYATVVHCDTPSGMLNDVAALCPLLKRYGILTVVDSVSAMFGNPLEMDKSGIDLLCGGSQKAVSAPPGLTFVSISQDARAAMDGRKTPVASFYANLKAFDGWYEKKWFPYTMPISDIYGLRTALENLERDEQRLRRHHKIAEAVRRALVDSGLGLHLEAGFSDTVSVFDVPQGLTAGEILDTVRRDYGILLAGSFDVLEGQVIRIGHMGNNAWEEKVCRVMEALDGAFSKLGYPLKVSLRDTYLRGLS